MGEAGEFMLFGVRVVVDSLRKSVSLNNLSQYEHPQDNAGKPDEGCGTKGDLAPAAGYASADEAVLHNSSASRGERKRGVPWTEEEHKLFLLGLKRVGKGDWRGISRNFVKTRTPTQVASHAQKYFLRRTNHNRRRRRSSLFDITTDTVSAIPMEEEQTHDHDKNNTGSVSHQLPALQSETSSVTNLAALPTFPVTSGPVGLPVPAQSALENLLPGKGTTDATSTSTNLIRPVSLLPAPRASPIGDFNLDLNLTSTVEPLPLSLNLSDWRETSSRHSAFQVMQDYSNGDSMISVA